jgi:hypothetical protein
MLAALVLIVSFAIGAPTMQARCANCFSQAAAASHATIQCVLLQERVKAKCLKSFGSHLNALVRSAAVVLMIHVVGAIWNQW